MRWHKFISSILHPVVMPTIGVLLYLILTDLRIGIYQKLSLVGIVLVATYLIPILLLVVLKSIHVIDSYQVKTIPERKIPILFMIVLFYFVGRSLHDISVIRDISYLFYGSSLGLVIVYLIFLLKVKTSLHLLSMGSAVGYFIIFQEMQNITVLPIILLFVLLSGILASSRLYLKAHVPKEVYLGFIVGVFSQLFVYFIL